MSVYKAVVRSNELYHFNKKHDRLGRFDTGDGDGDGIIDDHKNQRKDFSSGALGIDHRKVAKASGGWHPITKPYEHSSAADKPPKGIEKLPKSSIFKSGSFAEYKNKDGTVDNVAYTKSGAKKVLAGLGSVAVGKFLQNSDNFIVQGVGFTSEYLGWFTVGYGGAQTVVGLANQVHNANAVKR